MAWYDIDIDAVTGVMCAHNDDNGITCKGQDEQPLTAHVLLKPDFFEEKMSKVKRIYEFTSDNKAFIKGQLSNSVFLHRAVPDNDGYLFTADILKIHGLSEIADYVEWAEIELPN